MSHRAEARSIDAIAEFRTALLLYIHKIRPLLDDALDDAARTRDWIRGERRVYWENRVKKHSRELQDAQQALFSAQIAKLRAPSTAEVHAVHAAKRALNEAEDKVHALKRLAISFEQESQPRMKELERLRSVLSVDMRDGAHMLEKIVAALQSYAEVQLPPVEGIIAEGSAAPVGEGPASQGEEKK